MAVIDQLRQLPVSERLELVGALWDSIASEGTPALSPAHQEELDRRLERLQQHPDEGIEWAALKSKLLQNR